MGSFLWRIYMRIFSYLRVYIRGSADRSGSTWSDSAHARTTDVWRSPVLRFDGRR